MLIVSFAWIEYLMGTEKGEEVKKVVESNVKKEGLNTFGVL